jgi:phosphate transport system substrate-binding protein
MKKWLSVALCAWCVLVIYGCNGSGGDGGGGTARTGSSQDIRVDGSSTVEPISSAAAEEFGKANPDIRPPSVGLSGTGGGFKKFYAVEIDITGASRPISSEEDAECKKNGVEYIELPVAYDALAVVVNPKNTWVDHLTVAELKKMWEPAAEGKVTRWAQIRAGFPDKPLKLFGAGTDSGTFDYFTKAITGEEKASRGDYTPSEDDNLLVQGVASDEGGLGYFGLAYYEQNQDRLKIVPIDDLNPDNGAGPILPSVEAVHSGTYQPLARPLFIYVNKKALERENVKKFVQFYIENAASLAPRVGYIALPENVATLVKERLEKGTTGSVFGGHGSRVGVKIEDLLKAEEGQ